ncbi:transposase [Pseudomonas syringae pv. syringae]|uniref:Transposase n=1 Tax=Pseudomonas syringae pv. syringae TaxID=321 RepID=A0AB35JMX3_PSESY|nr:MULTISPECIES: DDE-type integrase/transposase/recombinase [Pseudomonas syringae group]MDC3735262.1 transposase [Pseudomonas syringae pv. syringae]
MKRTEIHAGLTVLYEGQVATITKCLENSHVELLRRSDGLSLRVPLHDINLLPSTDASGEPLFDAKTLLSLDEATPLEIQFAAERYELIAQFIAGKLTKAEICARLEISLPRFYQLLKSYDPEIGLACMLRRKRGRKAGVLYISEQIEKIISTVFKRRRVGRKITPAKAYQEVCIECDRIGIPPPSKSLVSARIKSLSPREACALQYGAEAANQQFGAKPGKRTVVKPLEVAQADHTLIDIILCDHKTRKPIGRPWLTVIIDTYSRVLLGYYIGFNAPSSISIATALCHAAFQKNQFMNSLGLDPEHYPFFGLPSILHMDNAKEFRSAKLERACAIHNVKTEFRPLGRKHYGGTVERFIGTMMTSKVHFLPGTTFSNTQKRKGYDSEKTSALSLKEFYKWFALEVVMYHSTPHRGLDKGRKSPKDVWLEYYNSGDVVKYPPVLQDPLRFRLDFLPEVRRTITTRGIEFNTEYYWSAGLSPYVGLKQQLVKYDPLSIASVWVWLGGNYVKASFSDVTKADSTLEESKISRYRLDKEGAAGSAFVFGLKNQSDTLVKTGISETKRARKKEAATAEYKDYLQTLDDSAGDQYKLGGTAVQVDDIDYSRKPEPFSSEDL